MRAAQKKRLAEVEAVGATRNLDILLIRGMSKSSDQLCKAQSTFFRKPVTYSHVAISLGSGICLHATRDQGVHLVRVGHFWGNEVSPKHRKVLRHRKLTSDCGESPETEARKLLEFASAVYAARYNYRFGLPKRKALEDRWFCSELAAEAFQKAGINVFPQISSKVFPGHFEHKRVHADWLDVTNQYDAYVRGQGSDDPFVSPFYLTHEALFRLYQSFLDISGKGRKAKKSLEESIS